MRKGSLGVTFFFSVRMSECPRILGKSVLVRPVSVQWSRSGLEVDRKWTGVRLVDQKWTLCEGFTSAGRLRPAIFIVVHSRVEVSFVIAI